MKTTELHKGVVQPGRKLQKFLTAAGLTAAMVLPVVTIPTPSEAKPPAHAPAHGYRNKDKDKNRYDRNRRDRNRYDRNRRDRDRRERDRRDRDRRDRNRWGRNANRTLTGVVVDRKSDQRFNFRSGGRSFSVYSPSRLPGSLNRGDTVRVYGRIDGNNINNANVSIIRNR